MSFIVADECAKVMRGALYSVEQMQKYRADIEPISAALDDAGLEKQITIFPGHYFMVYLTGSPEDLGKLWGVLRKFGYEPDEHVPAEKQPEFVTYFRKDDKTIRMCFTSTVCKRVQVGTKMEEVPVYEVKCDE